MSSTLRALLDAIPDPVIGCDPDGYIVLWNAAAERRYGYTAQEAAGKRPAALLRTRFPAPPAEISDELADVGHWHGLVRHRDKHGRECPALSSWVLARGEDGRPAGTVATERPAGEDVLVGESGPAARAPASRHEDPSPTAQQVHDLNNALAIMVNYAALVRGALKRAGVVPDEGKREALLRDLGEIETAGARATQVVADLRAPRPGDA
jgi:two-component system, LuxR family, sensor kinase FixL